MRKFIETTNILIIVAILVIDVSLASWSLIGLFNDAQESKPILSAFVFNMYYYVLVVAARGIFDGHFSLFEEDKVDD